jgi:hypothetical protein
MTKPTSKTKTKTTPPAPTVGRETLQEAPLRALKLLRAIGTSLPIRASLAARGYGDDDHAEGWSLLHAASGFSPGNEAETIDVGVRDAIRELDAWDEDGFRIVRASLERRYPAIAATVLDGIGPSTGPASIVGVATLLDRLDGLAKGKDKDGHAAIALLAKRGIDGDERKRLRALVDAAQTAPEDGVADVATNAAARRAADDAHLRSLAALRAWHEEWAAIARASIKRRDHLILMGLANRKSPTAPEAPAAGTNGSAAATTA